MIAGEARVDARSFVPEKSSVVSSSRTTSRRDPRLACNDIFLRLRPLLGEDARRSKPKFQGRPDCVGVVQVNSTHK
jgi:hypothetical protein